MTPYTNKLQQCLIETGKAVERREHEDTPSMDEFFMLFNTFYKAVADGDMKAMSVTSGEIIAAMVKWRVEKM